MSNPSPSSANSASKQEEPPFLTKGLVDFSLEPIQKQLICRLCQGYFRDPYTVTKCFHTFCKSCLYLAHFTKNDFKCPTCGVYTNPDIERVALPDRTLQNLIDKVLFPDVALEDREKEEAFYARLNISKKITASHDRAETKQKAKVDETVTFHLVPDEEADVLVPPLKMPVLNTDAAVTVAQLKIYLGSKLHLECPVEILCLGVPLKDEYNVRIVLEKLWNDESYGELKFEYRYASSD